MYVMLWEGIVNTMENARTAQQGICIPKTVHFQSCHLQKGLAESTGLRGEQWERFKSASIQKVRLRPDWDWKRDNWRCLCTKLSDSFGQEVPKPNCGRCIVGKWPCLPALFLDLYLDAQCWTLSQAGFHLIWNYQLLSSVSAQMGSTHSDQLEY